MRLELREEIGKCNGAVIKRRARAGSRHPPPSSCHLCVVAADPIARGRNCWYSRLGTIYVLRRVAIPFEKSPGFTVSCEIL